MKVGAGRRRLGRRFWLSFVAASIVVYLGETLIDRLLDEGQVPGLAHSIFNATGLYQLMVGAARRPLARYTSVVVIDSEKDLEAIGSDDVCQQRAQVARAVCRISTASPRVIVIDKFYGPKECGKGNEDIRKAFFQVSPDIPLVIGRVVPDDHVESMGQERHYLAPTLEFTRKHGAKLLEGVVNIERDTRKLALRWRLYPSREHARLGRDLTSYDTLALAAARGYDPDLLKNHPELAKRLNQGEHPYISFLRRDEFQPMSVGEILTGAETSSSAEFCRPEPPPKQIRKMGGKVVVIGEVDQIRDMHESVVGRLPGYLMQANFIEALLDDRHYRPVMILDYVYGFAVLGLLELILIVYRGRMVTMVLLVIATLAMSVGGLYLTLRIMGWYVNPVAVSVTAVGVRLLGYLFLVAERASERRKSVV